MIITRVNPVDGSIIWANRYGQSGGGDDVDQLNFAHNGDLLINGDLQGVGFGGVDAFVMRLSPDGTLITVNGFGGEQNDFINDLTPFTQTDGARGYLLTGATSSFNIDGTNDVWIIKTDENLSGFIDCSVMGIPYNVAPVNFSTSGGIGNGDNFNVSSSPDLRLNTNAGFTTITISDCPGMTVVDTYEPIITLNISLFPNPTYNQIELQGEDIQNIARYEVISILGNVIKQNSYNGKSISISELPNGLYHLVLFDKNEKVMHVEKIIKQ